MRPAIPVIKLLQRVVQGFLFSLDRQGELNHRVILQRLGSRMSGKCLEVLPASIDGFPKHRIHKSRHIPLIVRINRREIVRMCIRLHQPAILRQHHLRYLPVYIRRIVFIKETVKCRTQLIQLFSRFALIPILQRGFQGIHLRRNRCKFYPPQKRLVQHPFPET